MRVLNVINSLSLGGAEKLLSELVPLISDHGVECEVLCLSRKSVHFEKKLRDCGIRVTFSRVRHLFSPAQIFEISERSREFDIVHAHLFPAQYWLALSNVGTRGRRIVTSEHSNYNKRRKSGFFRPIERFIYGSYDAVICVSEEIETSLCLWLGSRRNLTVIRNGIDLQTFTRANDSTHPQPERFGFRLIMVARFDAAKDHATAVRSLSLLDNRYTLTFVGEGRTLEATRKLAKSLNLESRVFFLGFRDDVAELLRASDIAVLSSNWEGFGLSALEAMSLGVPVLASDIPGLRDVVGNPALLFPAGDFKELAGKIIELSRDEQLRRGLSEQCKVRATLFSLEKTASEYVRLYRKVVSQRSEDLGD